MADFTLETYRLEDAPAVVNLWNSTDLAHTYPMTERFWHQQTEGDPDFEPGDVTLAYASDKTLAGFVLIKRFRGRGVSTEQRPYFESSAGQGYIAAVAVSPHFQRQGLGTQLIQQAETQLQNLGAKQVSLGANLRHFFPAVPAELPGLPEFFSKQGYQFRPANLDQYDLRGSLEQWENLPAPRALSEGDFYFTQGQAGEEDAILAFLQRAFPGRWWYETDLFFKHGGSPADITLLKSRADSIEGFQMNYHAGSKVIGPGIYWSSLLDPAYGGIGPLGISKEVRGLGLGLSLVGAGIEYLKGKGVKDCVIDWTDLLEFYGKLGFHSWKRYLRAFKELA